MSDNGHWPDPHPLDTQVGPPGCLLPNTLLFLGPLCNLSIPLNTENIGVVMGCMIW
jgi:hypothetical protein